jgi:hypothetical protein
MQNALLAKFRTNSRASTCWSQLFLSNPQPKLTFTSTLQRCRALNSILWLTLFSDALRGGFRKAKGNFLEDIKAKAI